MPCCAKSLHMCPTLCDPMDCSLPGPSVHGFMQARIQAWVALPSSRESSWASNPTGSSCASCSAGGLLTAEPPGKPCLYMQLLNPAANAADMGSMPGSEASPGEGNGNPLQYSCLDKPMERGVWRATAHWSRNQNIWDHLFVLPCEFLHLGVWCQSSWALFSYMKF